MMDLKLKVGDRVVFKATGQYFTNSFKANWHSGVVTYYSLGVIEISLDKKQMAYRHGPLRFDEKVVVGPIRLKNMGGIVIKKTDQNGKKRRK